MTTYILTSEKFAGEVEFRYSEAGYLILYDNRACFTFVQHAWLLQHLPVSPDSLPSLTSAMHCKLIVIKAELTFERFWKQYFAGRAKDNSSRKRAETKWNRMSMDEQAKAYAYIPAYMGRVAYGTQPKHAETYLNSELWNG